MKTKATRFLIFAVLASSALAASVPASAHDGFRHGYGHYYGRPFVYGPRFVVAPPPAIVYRPARVYYPPAPEY
ncbi:MAG TPA: hypothetical protein VI363_06265 [Burkholderiales bacterium]